MTENKCGYQMHIFVTSFSAQHAPAWRCFCMVQPLRQPFRPKCTNRILQMHHQNPVVPPESGVHPHNPVCTYSVGMRLWNKWVKCSDATQTIHVSPPPNLNGENPSSDFRDMRYGPTVFRASLHESNGHICPRRCTQLQV